MKNNYKKNILSKALILGVITTPILVGTALIANSNTIANNSDLLITNLDIKKQKLSPPVVSSGRISPKFVNELVAYKESLVEIGSTWDGILVESDFKNEIEPTISVAPDAFKNQTKITSITLPTTVATIQLNAFVGTTNLTTISALGANWIISGAFNGTDGIIPGGIKLKYSTTVKLGNVSRWGTTVDKVDIIGHPQKPEGSIIDQRFITDLIKYKESLILGEVFPKLDLLSDDFSSATEISANAFQRNTKINSITLPTSVKSIGANAFDGASSLTSISALGVTSIGADAFIGTTSIVEKGIKLTYSENIKNDNATVWGTVIDKLNIIGDPSIKPEVHGGIITPQFVNQLIIYKNAISSTHAPWDGSLVESDFIGATSVDDGAFEQKMDVKSIILPTTVISIGANAFDRASSLTSISALGVTSIGANAFSGTTSIANKGIKLTQSANITIDQFELWGLPNNTSLDIIIAGSGFFDDVNNIYMIAGIGAGVLLLIAGGLTGFLLYRKNANGSDSEEKEAKIKMKDEARDEAIRRLKIEQRIKDAKKSNK